VPSLAGLVPTFRIYPGLTSGLSYAAPFDFAQGRLCRGWSPVGPLYVFCQNSILTQLPHGLQALTTGSGFMVIFNRINTAITQATQDTSAEQ
jgi:hypothetical protein